jgi:alkylation response protein AidB-like acyl-CoA dehydrogenase
VDLSLTDEQQALIASFESLLTKESPPERVRAAEPSGFDPRLWQALLDVGVTEMAAAEAHGGWGAELLDLALVAECVGAAAAAAPVIEAQCAVRLLGSVVDSTTGVADTALRAALSGERLVTMAVRPARRGRATLVPAGAVADDALVLDGDRLLLVRLEENGRRSVANLASAPLADVDLERCLTTELCSGVEALARFDATLDEWLVLTAAALVGLAGKAHRVTCDYAVQRRTWNAPIGSYQAVAHPLADGRTAMDGARLLASYAACELGAGSVRGRALAAMAFGFAAETARDVTYDAVHFHGGFGVTLESEVQLYYRRARGWARVWDEPRNAYRRAARASRTGSRPTGPEPTTQERRP